MLLYALLEAASRYGALDCNQYCAQRKYPSYKEFGIYPHKESTIDDCAKDGGAEFFTEMHCVL